MTAMDLLNQYLESNVFNFITDDLRSWATDGLTNRRIDLNELMRSLVKHQLLNENDEEAHRFYVIASQLDNDEDCRESVMLALLANIEVLRPAFTFILRQEHLASYRPFGKLLIDDYEKHGLVNIQALTKGWIENTPILWMEISGVADMAAVNFTHVSERSYSFRAMSMGRKASMMDRPIKRLFGQYNWAVGFSGENIPLTGGVVIAPPRPRFKCYDNYRVGVLA